MKKHLLLIVLISISLFILVTNEWRDRGRVYDCGMAEWHPDIPKEVKEECRRIRHKEKEKQFEQGRYTT